MINVGSSGGMAHVGVGAWGVLSKSVRDVVRSVLVDVVGLALGKCGFGSGGDGCGVCQNVRRGAQTRTAKVFCVHGACDVCAMDGDEGNKDVVPVLRFRIGLERVGTCGRAQACEPLSG